MNSRHRFVSEDGSISVPSTPMSRLTNGDEDEYFERITRAMKEYRWREEDFLLATYPKNGNILKKTHTVVMQHAWLLPNIEFVDNNKENLVAHIEVIRCA